MFDRYSGDRDDGIWRWNAYIQWREGKNDLSNTKESSNHKTFHVYFLLTSQDLLCASLTLTFTMTIIVPVPGEPIFPLL